MSKNIFLRETINTIGEREFNVSDALKVIKTKWSIAASWGMNKPRNYKNKVLLFRVQGYRHKGWVVVTLAWNDTFTVRLLSNQYNEVHKSTDVYVDRLRDQIDDLVENQPEYVF